MPDACRCNTPPIDHRDFESRELGIDETRGRFAEVGIERCRHCGQHWLRYRYEIEGISRSGRWYRGAIEPAQAESVTPAAALNMLSRLAWYLYGGSYFGSTGMRSDTPLEPTLC